MDDKSKHITDASGLAGSKPEDTTTPRTQAPPSAVPAKPADHGKNDLFPEFPLLWLFINLIDPAPRRVRRALESQTKAVMRSIERFGFRIPILVCSKPGGERYEVVDGHARLQAALLLGAERVPCILVDDLPDVERRRLALSLNKLQENGEWDDQTLRLEINEIIEIGGDIEIPGFEVPEIEAIRFGAVGPEDPDPADDTSRLTMFDRPLTSRAGDTWLLGDHVILCGSARDGVAVSALLDGAVADVVFTDPPYNLKINGTVRSAKCGFAEFAEGSGEMNSAGLIDLLCDTLGNAADMLKPGGVLFSCMDWRHVGEMSKSLDTLGLDLLNICVWVKTHPGMGGLYRNQHEFVFVARRPGAGHQDNVMLGKFGRNRSNVWAYAGATGGRADADDDFNVHPTVKPIRMVMDALLDVTGPGDLVLDPFLGSGTTLLAAERTRRRCIGVEIDPAYVDLAIRRWQAMTGGQAIHTASGATFDSVAVGETDAGSHDQEAF